MTQEPGVTGIRDIAVEEFFLTEDALTFTTSRGNPLWVPVERDGPFFLGLALAAGETATSRILKVDIDSTLLCETASGDVSVLFSLPDGERNILRIATPSSVLVDLSAMRGLSGRIIVRAEEDASILKWIVGRIDRIALLAARTHHDRRTSNEISHFTNVYDLEFYKNRGISSAIGTYEKPIGTLEEQDPSLPETATVGAMSKIEAKIGENAYAYAHRLLKLASARDIPDFPARLRALYHTRPVRILSLCSGAAGVERGIFAAASVPIEVTLFDINESLVGRAAATLAPYARVFGVLGDVNTISRSMFDTEFDVVMCVSGLHHVVELEAVLSAASDLLVDGGEFWAVGEQIGRNGNRLWPEVREAANAAFSRLPPELRYNVHRKRVDDALPETDFSATSFEGIRSSEIERLLLSYFEPIDTYRRNCFLWRILETTYCPNYDLKIEAHLHHVHELVAAEISAARAGGRPTELWGVYGRR